MSVALSVSDQIRQLNDARKLVLQDVKFYRTVLQGILPIIGPTARLELRRWGAEFLAEAFATPALPIAEKETMLLPLLDALREMVENPQEDVQVLRSLIQAAASIYPLALKWMYVLLPRSVMSPTLPCQSSSQREPAQWTREAPM